MAPDEWTSRCRYAPTPPNHGARRDCPPPHVPIGTLRRPLSGASIKVTSSSLSRSRRRRHVSHFPVSVLVADGQRLFVDALILALALEPDLELVAAQPTTGEAAIEAVAEHRPDIVLLDYFIIGIGGTEAARIMSTLSPAPRVLLLSWISGPDHVQKALAAGAVGFLPKSLTVDQIAEAVRRAHRGDPLVYGDQVAAMVDGVVRRSEEAEERWAKLKSLTDREIEVLERLGQGQTRKQIAQELHIAVGTVKNHVHSILSKTGAKTQLEVVLMARHERLIVEPGQPRARPYKPPETE